MRIVLDIETNSTHDHIWLCVTKNIDTGEVICHTESKTLSPLIEKCDTIIGHNLISFDAPILNKLWKTSIKPSQVKDTLILSRLWNPSLEGGHSLGAWGTKLGNYKGDFKDWDSGLSQEMIDYCIQDVQVTHQLYDTLTKYLIDEQFDNRSIDLEHKVQAIIAKQEKNGFRLDERKSVELLSELKGKLFDIETELQSVFPAKTIKRVSEKTGKDLKDRIEIFNPGSRKQIAERLQEKGWKPKKHTEKGQVIVDESTLADVDIPEAKKIVEYLMLQKRISQVESWMDAVAEDGRVHGRVITNGAVTGRMTHHSPNMAQVPNSSAIYGEECRELWTVEKGYKLVGIDASGLELRMLAHYMNDDAYTTEVVSGDIHTANQRAAGLETRNQAKTFIYAFLYGAGASKIGKIVGGSAREGEQLIASFLKNTPKLRSLREKVSRIFSEKGTLPSLDGRRLRVRSEHSALNTLLQGAGAIVMKQALVLLDKKLRSAKIDYKFVANVHDEWQIEVEEARAEEVGKLGVESIAEAGQVLSMRCPLTGEYKVGNNWKETH
jgi:DNA polymerase I-like protein with 3'-5' exonuclease and polymerase domains